MKKALIQLHTAVLLAGFTAVLGKLIALNEGLLVWYRLLLTVAALWLLLHGGRRLQRISRSDMARLLGVGGIVAVHWVSFYGSVKYGTISVALTCFSATGFFTAFFEPLVLRRRINLADVLLGLMAIAGIYIIFDFHPQYKVGILFGLVGAMGSGLFPVFNKLLLARVEPYTLTFYEMCGGLLLLTLLLPLYLQAFPAAYYLPAVSDWLWLLVLALLCTVLSFILQLNALKKLSAFTANLSYNMEPLYGIVLAFVFFGENKYLNSGFYIGLVLIGAAVVLQMVRVMRRRG